MAPSPLSDPGNVAFLQPLCRSSVAQSCLSMVAASMAATRRCGSTLAGSCPHVRFQPLWFFAALLCGDALTATERVLECHRVGSAGWVLSSPTWRGAMKM